uniref:Serpin domain-containing protein n=1 Tax=Compsopogon caeruleus TaxID=31354 RepID=A0A7S1XC79_9RHOD|mmetsp:Transcript_13964/g.28592  ORF Transcript_13964/g.28592 Transcript_13964/m.28592 type:complete len:462 (+) Transcript_13964:133-1518(+)|eukprot:CAMPEP_0184685998 /NCGR_PEP_ID=MMETSP0312-20130426/20975_1 /TAXON_ID=31354 /ORGANISM="Compsopogon coeruleus, Strain SAG 36.94" /LENGTH=461 /DNA_ID=CAMNT_0027140653 /DNA_START=125 /DNA_END=1510 /DNA_ORIENTATION=+
MVEDLKVRGTGGREFVSLKGRTGSSSSGVSAGGGGWTWELVRVLALTLTGVFIGVSLRSAGNQMPLSMFWSGAGGGRGDMGCLVRDAVEFARLHAGLISRARGFAWGMLRETSKPDDNVVESPLSVDFTLGMVGLGAAGKTLDEIVSVVGGGERTFHDGLRQLRGHVQGCSEKDGPQIRMANRLFVEQSYSLLPDFVSRTAELYGASASSIDFKGRSDESRKQINDLVGKDTAGKIKDLFPPGSIGSDSRAVLVNAIYFKGKWALPFDKRNTRNMPFKNAAGNPVDVPMMSRHDSFESAYHPELGAQFLKMRYVGGNLSMVIILPVGSTPLSQVEAKLNQDFIQSVKFAPSMLRVFIPRFQLESSFELGDSLGQMGIREIFSKDTCNLSLMSEQADLFVSRMIHKAYIEVNEEGTEASAATGALVSTRSLPPQFLVDRPFLFAVQEERLGLPLFVGRVSNL